MEWRRRGRLASATTAACVVVATSWGCGEQLAAPDIDTGVTANFEATSARAGAERLQRFACFVSARETEGTGYRYLLVPLHFGSGRIGDGTTSVLRLRGYGGQGSLEVAANCVIPNTPRTAAQVVRQLAPRGEFAMTGTTIQGCVVDETGENPCILEGIVANGCQYGGIFPDCREPFENDIPECYDGGGCGGGPVVSSGGGSSPCEECLPPDEQPGPNCPSILSGKVITMGIVVTARLHTFKFSGPMRRLEVFDSSPTWYAINPTTSEDAWWVASRGKILVSCWGVYVPLTNGTKLWIGTAWGVPGSTGHDVSLVMGPGHPNF